MRTEQWEGAGKVEPAFGQRVAVPFSGRAFRCSRIRTLNDPLSAARLLFVAALLPGLYQLVFPAGFGFGPGHEMTAIARSLARTGSFADPFAIAGTGVTANQPPLYPFFLAALVKLFGDTPLFAFVATLACIAVQALHAALLPRLSVLLYGEMRVGIYAGVLSVFAFQLMPHWDAIYTATGLILFCLCSARVLDKRRSDTRAGAITGALAGGLVLLNPASLLASAPYSLFLALRRKTPCRRVLMFSSAFGFGLVLICLPWILRNYVRLGVLGLRDNFGITFQASNNACAGSSLMLDGANGCHQLNHPNTSLREARELQNLGEAEYGRRKTAVAFDWISQNRERFRTLTLKRILEFWFPARNPESPAYCTYSVWLITALSIPGLAIAAIKRMPVALFTVAVWLLYPAMYYVVVSDVRYRYPILWLSLLCAGYAISRVENLNDQ